jgi:hypothetical protein
MGVVTVSVTPTLAQRFEVLSGPRIERFWVELLSERDEVLFTLDGVEGGTVEYNYDSRIRGGFKLTLADTGQPLNWLKLRLRPWAQVNLASWPLGVYVPNSPTAKYTSTGKVWEVSCLDKTSALDLVKVPQTYSVGVDANVTTLVEGLIEASGETGVSLTPSDKTTRTMLAWPPGTSTLTIVNDLLDAINYSSLWTDGWGHFRAEPYVPPADRRLIAEFQEGEFSVHLPEFTREQDIANIPNRVLVVSEGDDERETLTAEVYNTDANSPYSYQARGGWITRVYESNAVDQETLNAQASRYMARAQNPIATLDITHAVVPVEGAAKVRFTSADLDVYAVINEYSMDLAVGALMSSKLNEVTGEADE